MRTASREEKDSFERPCEDWKSRTQTYTLPRGSLQGTAGQYQSRGKEAVHRREAHLNFSFICALTSDLPAIFGS